MKFSFANNNSIELMYDGAGQKLRKTVKTNGVATLVQDYLGGIELKNNKFEAIHNEEGRAVYKISLPLGGSGWEYEYSLKDHLGNTRVSFTDKNANGIIENQTEVLSETHYYPFGLAMNGAWYNDATTSASKYLYNDKELNDEFGLNLNDYGARWYDASIGRWWNTDPLAEAARRYSPYVYGNDNPVRFIDPDGMESRGADNLTNEQWVSANRDKDGKQGEKMSSSRKENFNSDNQRAAELRERGQSREINENDYYSIKGVHGVYQKYTPNIYAFTLFAFSQGQPNILHYEPLGKKERRPLVMKQMPRTLRGYQRDEYPYASTKEGGLNAMVTYVPERENRLQGAHLGGYGGLYNFLSSGDAFLVMPIPDLPDSFTVLDAIPTTYMEQMEKVTGYSGAALVLYIIVSEGSRVFPLRNLVPVP